MDWDEPRARPKAGFTIGEDLAQASIAELETRLETLRAEIARIEAAVAGKRRQQQAAASIFKS